jgi:hypothetical protein
MLLQSYIGARPLAFNLTRWPLALSKPCMRIKRTAVRKKGRKHECSRMNITRGRKRSLMSIHKPEIFAVIDTKN